ncbi:hypothetical protein [Aquibium carbonis]|uniref:hypothetical protein n=1 Tax=Aquibium carbonis TaxID=2495581 RepID=UPI001AECB06F|nr:hypothetical protein [Aquibium carbonis]
MPKFTRVCEEIERGSISFAEAFSRNARAGDFLLHQRLLHFQFLDALLVGTDHGIARRVDDAIQKLSDFPLDFLDLFGQRRALRARARQLRIPLIAEHFESEMEQAFRRLQRGQENFKLAFDLFFPHRLARFRTAARVAQIVRIARATPFRPTGGQRLVAARTGDKAP